MMRNHEIERRKRKSCTTPVHNKKNGDKVMMKNEDTLHTESIREFEEKILSLSFI